LTDDAKATAKALLLPTQASIDALANQQANGGGGFGGGGFGGGGGGNAGGGGGGQQQDVQPVPDADNQVVTTFTAYAQADQADEVRYAQALKDLDTKVGYTQKTRVNAFLTLAGVVDYTALGIGGPGVIFAPVQHAPVPQTATAPAPAPAPPAAATQNG